jgi:hypothetical protein
VVLGRRLERGRRGEKWVVSGEISNANSMSNEVIGAYEQYGEGIVPVQQGSGRWLGGFFAMVEAQESRRFVGRWAGVLGVGRVEKRALRTTEDRLRTTEDRVRTTEDRVRTVPSLTEDRVRTE